LITDLASTTAHNIAQAGPDSLEAVRRAPPLASFSTAMRQEADELKRFLHANLYRHYQVMRMTTKAARIVRELFQAFLDDPRLLPPQFQHADAQPRAIADYIAGMTDRYAIREHSRLFD